MSIFIFSQNMYAYIYIYNICAYGQSLYFQITVRVNA